ncbi:MAG: alpha/beta hydrolase-fold protein [Pseudomonadota bacterium]
MRILIVLFLLAFVPPAHADAACTLEAPCSVGEGAEIGEYAMLTPEGWDGEAPLRPIMFLHGHNSSMKSTINSGSLRSSFVDQGFVLIAPQGNARNGAGPRRWPGTPDPDWRDDRAFLLAVLDDVAARLPLAGVPVISGFSAGGSMAWMMGCYHGDRFGAVISVAGALRRPNSPDCTMPPRALHVHGFGDSQVPLEGRGIRDWHQGTVADTLALFRQSRGCRSNPDAITIGADWRTRVWQSCVGGHLAYVEHDGGHGLPRGWSEIAARWLESGALPQE